jgi:HK97 family phage prohead protease
MPWHAAKSGACPASKPWAVIKNADGKVVGCHETSDSANKQIAALYANEPGGPRMSEKPPPVRCNRAYVTDIEVRADGDGRTIAGVLVPFGRTAVVSDGGPSYQEGFERGAFAKTLRERLNRVKLLSQHNSRSNPLGKATLLREDAAHLYGEFRVSQTAAGDEALALARDGALDSFSIGFTPIKHVRRGRVTWRTEVGLRETSLVTFPAYDDARIEAVRAWEDLSDEEREAALLLSQAHDLRSTTPDGEPGAAGTSVEAAPADEPREHSARSISLRTRIRAARIVRGME